MTLKEMIAECNNIVFFGGAGVSTASGIPDFRSVDGLYKQKYEYPPETVLSHSFFLRKTEYFYKFYRDKMLYLDAKPNAAHIKLAELEAQGKLKAVVTQNIDGLHQAAGSKNVFELHGSVLRNSCMRCGKKFDVQFIKESEGIPRCSCGGTVKPDVVLYEECLDDACINGAVDAISKADMLIVGGTSLSVYPAAGLVQYFRGKYLVLVNKSETNADKDADLVIREGIAEVFSAL
ncbi:MAG: NAD-dependent protein deacylase [Christensenellaceae bacterium]|nr:NAD-dependent protein deacylase [Christensenellaceae bacterium]